MNGQRIPHYPEHTDQGGEDDIDRSDSQLLDVGAHFLKLAERLAATLILEDAVRQFQGVPQAVAVYLSAHPLHNDVDEIVLEILRDARHKGDANGRGQQ